jgi:NDP-sugar pyrophosphorylase family protein
MKGMILAAGEGKRLLYHIITHLRDCGVTDLAINLHHLPAAVIDYFGDGSQWGVSLRYSVEDSLLGSAGGVKRLQPFFDDTFMVYYGDVYTRADLVPMITRHRRCQVLATMALYRVPDPWNRGIVELDDQEIVTRFVEKPARERAFSDLANAGIYVLEPDVLEWIPAGQPWDFGHDVFPALLAAATRVAGYIIKDSLLDIGLPEKYQQADRLASQQIGPANFSDPLTAKGVAS